MGKRSRESYGLMRINNLPRGNLIFSKEIFENFQIRVVAVIKQSIISSAYRIWEGAKVPIGNLMNLRVP